MKDADKTKEQLINELVELRRRVAELGVLETERKRAEEVLRESEHKYRALFETILDGAFVIDAETMKIVFANQVAAKMYGFDSAEDVVGMNPVDYIPPDDRERASRIIAEDMFEKDLREVHEFRTTTRDAREIWISAIGMRTEYQGRLAGMISLRDITERKRAEEELLESEERYRSLINLGGAVGEAIVMLQDTEQGDGIQTFVSREWPRITGYSKKELLSMSFFNLVHPRYREASRKRHERRMRGEDIPKLFELSIIRKDGTEVPIEITSAYSTYKGERANVVFIRNITERKRAEEKTENLAKFPSENPNPVLRVAKDGTILYANEASLPLLNTWRTKTGKPMPDFWHKLFSSVLISGLQRNFEHECEGRIFSFTLAPVTDANYTNIYGLDITERKETEEREKRLQQELHLSSRLAAIGQLAAGVAHEINNPLTGILGYSELLLRKPTDENTRKGLEIIHSSSLRVAKIVQNLLTFARHRQPKKEYVDINEIVKEALELRAYELKTSNIEVALDLAPDLPQIMGDFHQTQEVFLNLILNAEQAMTEAHRGGKLIIKTKQLKDRVRVSFTDDGPGIPAEHLNKLFDPFFSTRGEKGGTGLGLSLCHGIVEEHKGRIYAKSKMGEGATLFVELPVTT